MVRELKLHFCSFCAPSHVVFLLLEIMENDFYHLFHFLVSLEDASFHLILNSSSHNKPSHLLPKWHHFFST